MLLARNPNVLLPPTFTVPQCGTGGMAALAGALSANSSPTANRAYYLPFVAPRQGGLVSVKFYCATGTNNHDLGLYNAAGTCLGTKGATATTAAAVNTWTPATPIPVVGGAQYWVALSMASAVPTIFAPTSINTRASVLGIAIQAAAHPLPTSSATFAAGGGVDIIPYFAITVQ